MVGAHFVSRKNTIMKVRIVLGIVSVAGLVMVFLFQRINIAAAMDVSDLYIYQFMINRSIRFVLNDFLAIGLIYALFGERKYVVFALWVQGIGIVFFLVPYFMLKIQYPAYNGPLLSFLHRLILNPTLLLLLIPAFYYQKKISSN
jgi:exosortase F-associated protein